MDWLELLYKLIEVAVIPMIGVAVTYLVKYLQAKKEAVANEMDNALLEKYTSMLFDTVSNCVIATTQTYVDSLKTQGAFDAEAQKVAFNATYDAVMNILSAEAKDYLSNAVGDLQAYITNLIEAQVNRNK